MASLRIPGALLAVLALLFVAPPSALAEPLPNPGPPPNAADARGTTFTGTVVRHFTRQVQDHELAFVTFHVERVLALDGLATGAYRPHAGADFDIYTSMGFGVDGLVDGARYLFSSSQIPSPQSGDTAAWRIYSGGRVAFVEMSSFLRHGDPRLRRVTTLAAAIALMVPDLPATDAASPTPAGPDAGRLLAMVAGGFAGLLAFVHRRRSSRRTVGGGAAGKPHRATAMGLWRGSHNHSA